MKKIDYKVAETFFGLVRSNEHLGADGVVLSRDKDGHVRDRITANPLHVSYYLFDTCIASFDKIDRKIYLFVSSLGAGSRATISLTTKNRLNAILWGMGYRHDIIQKNYRLFVGDKEIRDGCKYAVGGDCDFAEVR